jgi:hypothetical protein
MIEALSTDISEAVATNPCSNMNDLIMVLRIQSIMFNIVQQCSTKIFQVRIATHPGFINFSFI